MKKIENVLICGIGAIGTIYAARLFDKPQVNLKILADKERIQKYTQNPTVFNGKSYKFNFLTPEENWSADFVIIATKNNGLNDVIKDIKNFVSENTVIISLLNGIESEDVISRSFGQDKVLYSYFIGHASTRNGRSITHDGVYTTVFGEKSNKNYSENVKRVKDFFDKTGINYEIPEDMDYSRWWKFILNVGYNQASAVLRANYGEFQNSEKTNSVAVNLMKEAVALAKAEGVNKTENIIPEIESVIKAMIPETKTSMLQDVESKRETEIDIFSGYIKKLAQKHSLQTPYNSLFFELIKAIDEKNKLT